MSINAKYSRSFIETSPTEYDNNLNDGYNEILIDVAEINGGEFLDSSPGIILVEVELLAAATSSGDNTAAGAIIRRGTYYINSTNSVYICRQEGDRFFRGSRSDWEYPRYTVYPTSANLTKEVAPFPSATNSLQYTQPSLEWPLRSCMLLDDSDVNGHTVIKLQWSIYKHVGHSYNCLIDVNMHIFKP